MNEPVIIPEEWIEEIEKRPNNIRMSMKEKMAIEKMIEIYGNKKSCPAIAEVVGKSPELIRKMKRDLIREGRINNEE